MNKGSMQLLNAKESHTVQVRAGIGRCKRTSPSHRERLRCRQGEACVDSSVPRTVMSQL